MQKYYHLGRSSRREDKLTLFGLVELSYVLLDLDI